MLRHSGRRGTPGSPEPNRPPRLLDTAQLAFGRVAPWPALDSSFGDRATQGPQNLPRLLDALGRIGAGAFEVWVTHQSNITGWTSLAIDMGEGFVVAPAGRGFVVATAVRVASGPAGPLRVSARLRLGA